MTRDAAQGLAHIRAFSMKAIETRYAGCKFRSRLEARWAVFFDALGLTWEYEPEGFETDAGWYLPDFLITCKNITDSPSIWIEVKPQTLNDNEREKAFGVSSHTNKVLIALNQIPDPYSLGPYGPFVGGDFYLGAKLDTDSWEWFVRDYVDYVGRLVGMDVSGDKPHDMSCAIHFEIEHYADQETSRPKQTYKTGKIVNDFQVFGNTVSTEKLRRACVAARSARFEHGETP